MPRFIHALCCLLTATCLSALDQPLILTVPIEAKVPYTFVINPGTGSIQIYETSNNGLRQKSSHNFLAEYERLRTVTDKTGRSFLRTGSAGNSNSPDYNKMNELLGSLAGVGPQLAQQAIASEDAFWSKPPTYDGRLQATLGQHTLFLLIPCSFTILAYQLDNFDLELKSLRNFRSDLYIPDMYQSTPGRSEMLVVLKSHPDPAVKKWVAQHLQELEQEWNAAAKTGRTSLVGCDTWMSVVSRGSQERLLVLDWNNTRIIGYDYLSKGRNGELRLATIRNIELDLKVPVSYKAEPGSAQILDQLNDRMAKDKMPKAPGVRFLRELADKQQIIDSKSSPFQVAVVQTAAGPTLMIEDPKRRKILVYNIFGRNNNLELNSLRDYTTEAGASIWLDLMQRRQNAESLLERLPSDLRSMKPDEGLERVRLILTWNPHLYKSCESQKDVRKALSELADWQPIIEKAMAAAKAWDDKIEAILKKIREDGDL